VQNAIVGIILVSLILFYVLGQGGRRQAQDSLFVALLVSTFLIIVFEFFVDVFSGSSFYGSRFIIIFSTYVFYIINPFPSVFYLLYLHQLHRRWTRIPRTIAVIAFTPAILGLILTTVSLFNGMIYSIDAHNVYHRGSSFYLIVIIDFLCFIFGVVYLIYYRESFKKKDFSLFVFFPIPVIIGAVLQSTFYGIELTGLSLAITLLIVYLQMQNSQANKDYLTLLYNRRVSETYLQYLLQNKKRKWAIGGVMMDINNFKYINDQYGHDLGDRSLRYISRILTESFKNNWLIARYGGDEFILFKEMSSAEGIEKELAHFNEHISHFNESGNLPFTISMSIGFASLAPSDDMDVSNFIKLLDNLMYDNKREYYATHKKNTIINPVVEK
jgi:diguanylate cyclase (GGDEF)-like protein